MNTIKFLNKDSKTILAYTNEGITHLNTNDAPFVKNILNSIMKNEDVSCYDPEIVEELKSLLINEFHFKPIDSIKSYTFGGKGSLEDLNLILDNDREKIIYIQNKSINEIKHYITSKIVNAVFVINIGHVLIISPYLQKDGACIQCLLNRWIEANPDLYSEEFILNTIESVYTTDVQWEMAKEIALTKIRYKDSKVSMLNKWNSEITTSSLLKRESCPNCFEYPKKETGNFSLKPREYISQDNGQRSHSYHNTLKLLEPYVNPLGPIIHLEETSHLDKIEIPVFKSIMSCSPDEKDYSIHGGKGPNYYQAKISAICEALERYNARRFGNEVNITGNYQELKEKYNILNPQELTLDPSFPYPFSENKKYEWTWAKRLNDDSSVLVPVNTVFFVYHPKNEEYLMIPQDTSGLASGLNIEEATLQGILEVIERDAYAIYYRKQLPSPIIQLNEDSNPAILDIVSKLIKQNIKVHLKYLKTDVNVHVVHCVTEDLSSEFPKYTHGSGAALTPTIAVMRAITEAIQLRTSQIEILQTMKDYCEVHEYIPYIEWGNGNKEYVKDLLENFNDESISLSSLSDLSTGCLKKDIETITRQLDSNGFDVYVADLTRQDNVINTVRVLIPGFQGLDDSLRRNTKRLESLPKKIGVSTTENFTLPFFS
ncbi:YcaO-like family protein [Sutcliffiella cohnii]